ncbi:RagB/SusD family nutrient uptake outer membrane protein [Bacteroides nordii]|uniref:RagB/SusD family nutrient uptake outer membrane protein n=1 Tax=Bacteroides nordii TaxID=291645 RepID=UPI002109B960|nr:RagB/SusD family nutrient uptake outer membrane protein [Bacteroides nordii]MCQ4914033.1 RagB/SusD family nutrient uptake outer membrane protein [Bacteroides nordii]
MKKLKLIYFLLAICTFSSCLDEDPQYALNSESVFLDENTAQLALLSCYGQLTTYDGFGQAAQELLVGASGLGWAQTNASDQDRYVSLNVSSGCVITKMFWRSLYKTVSETTFFIENMKESPLDEDFKTGLVAQAKFLRGFSYYHLLTTFGGVPLRNTIPSLKSLSIPRATEEEIAAQIESDWKDAIGGLTETADAGKASGLAAHAYLAKLYWYMACQGKQASGNKTYWELALEQCEFVYGKFQLEPNYSNLFVQHSNSKESIFQLNFSTESSTTGNRGSWIFAPQNSTAGISWGRIRISKAFHDYLKGTYPDDPRYSATVLSTWVNKSNGENQFAYPKLSYKEGRVTHNVEINYSICNDPTNPTVEELEAVDDKLVKRFVQPTGEHYGWSYYKKAMDLNSTAQNSHMNLIVYRYADFLLMMADVLNESGETGKAISLVKEVLQRARQSGTSNAVYPKDWETNLTKDQVRDKIFWERLVELAGEQTMYCDVRRRGTEYLKKVLEIQNNHHITRAIVENKELGEHRFKERLFNNGDLTENFLKKNLRLPIPQEELNTNESISASDQNYGY